MHTNKSNTHADPPLGSRWAEMWVHMWALKLVRFLVYVTKGNICYSDGLVRLVVCYSDCLVRLVVCYSDCLVRLVVCYSDGLVRLVVDGLAKHWCLWHGYIVSYSNTACLGIQGNNFWQLMLCWSLFLLCIGFHLLGSEKGFSDLASALERVLCCDLDLGTSSVLTSCLINNF